jgi:hypothetical protein
MYGDAPTSEAPPRAGPQGIESCLSTDRSSERSRRSGRIAVDDARPAMTSPSSQPQRSLTPASDRT